MKIELNTILQIAVIVLLVMILRGCNSPKPPDHSKENELYDRLVKTIEQQRDEYKQRFDSAIALQWKRDSLLKTENKVYVNRIKEVPVIINSLDRDGLRREVSNFGE